MRRRDLIGLGLGLASSKLFCAPPAAWDLSCDVAVAEAQACPPHLQPRRTARASCSLKRCRTSAAIR